MPRHLNLRPSSAVISHIALALIGLILIAPLLQAAPLCTDDGALHLYRTVALDRALNDGLVYPRWFPDLAYGYGFPFFNYREPLGYYVVEALHLIGASFPLALNLILALSAIAAGQAMMLWVSDIFDHRAGFMAGLVYMAAPYTLIDALTRANLPEAQALALMPLILWAFRRLLIAGGRRYFALATLSYAALLLTHNISSLIFTPILLAYCILRISTRGPRPAVRVALFAIALALALTAFFWLPALAEGNYAQLYLTHSTHGNDYHFNFLPLAEMFSGPGTSDPTLLNPPLRILLGWPQALFAVAGVAVIGKLKTREQRSHIIAAAGLLIVCVFMALSISLPVWDNLPLIRFVQFPWRFVGRAILPAALLAGAATYAVTHSSLVTRHSSLSIALPLCLAVIVLASATPQLYPRVCTIKPDLTITDVFNYERTTGHIGVDPLGAYLPATVKDRPTGSPLEAQYARGVTIQRLDRTVLPNGTQILSEAYQPNHAAIDLDTPNNFRATYLTFDFPGWQIRIDGQPTPIMPSDPAGLITFDVPAGSHHIEVAFGSTPIRTFAEILSLASLGVLVAVIVRFKSQASSQPKQPYFIFHSLSFIFIPMVFLLLKVALIDPQFTPLRQSQLQNEQLSGAIRSVNVDFGHRLRLIGYALTPDTAPAGETIRVDLYWRALQKLDMNYQTTVGLVDSVGEIWSPKTLYRPRDYQDYPATTTWPTDAYVLDSFELPINPGTPPGTYSIFAEVFTRATLQPLPVAASAPQPASRPAAALITSFNVTRAIRTFNADELGIYNFQFDRQVTTDLKLLGLNLDRSDVLPGDTVLLTFFWQTAQAPIEHTLTLQVLDAQQQVAAENQVQLNSAQWAANAQLIDLRRVRVKTDLATGRYRWRGLIDGVVAFEAGDLRVTAPDRSFIEPAIQHRIDQTLGGQVTLLGYDRGECVSRGTPCTITLYWRDEAELNESYKVFVQLLAADGLPRTQVDAVPINGARPTTSWLPREVITDAYTLQIPADLPTGTYRLVVGLYQDLSNTRLTLPDGRDSVDLGTLEFSP